ncbi:MAG: flagellar basal body P-ring formation chaperone FlgA [Tropicimonas sp.]|uniref:flagellar basal body P-ring formation chaperone FlgA n=1 Tax=Tropicimonas sp. TaxID=2067044 RepID=UPI003A889D1A
MTRGLILLLCLTLAGPAGADALVARHTIRSKTILSAQDVQLIADTLPGALDDPADAIGLEARVVLYAGRAIRADDLAPPAMIERNQVIPLVFDHGGLRIAAEGRSLARAAVGELVRVMNLQSRSTVSGTVDPHGRVIVGPSETRMSNMETLR